MESLRCIWEVTAGVVPDVPETEYTRRIMLTSKEWDGGSKEGVDRLLAKQGEAMVQALSLQNPAMLNWVRLDWVWF